jgi:hypothetical protein
VVGITGIIVNVGKVHEMCRMTRELSPQSVIVGADTWLRFPALKRLIDANHTYEPPTILEGSNWVEA